MTARIEVVNAIEAAQADRKAADEAGATTVVADIHKLIVLPVNQQLAR